MQDFDKANFEALLRGIADICSTTKTIVVNRPMLQVYFMTLSEYSYEQVEQAIGKHLKDPKHGSFFPKPADIVRHIDSQQLTIENRAKLAWIEILGEVRRTGSYGNLEIEDKQAVAALKAICSWKELCMTDQDKMQWIEKRFVDTYETYDKTPLDMLPDKLPGRIYLDKHKTEKLENKSLGKDFAKLMNNIKPK